MFRFNDILRDFRLSGVRMRHSICLLFLIGVAATSGCSVSSIIGDPSSTPEGEGAISPDAVKTAEGAVQFYNGVLWWSKQAVIDELTESALLTDELRLTIPLRGGIGVNQGVDPIDGRRLPEVISAGVTPSFRSLQLLRANARQGRALLSAYAPTAPVALIGRLYALEGYADLLLADLYCSGIPLSMLNPDGSFTLGSGSTTEEVYRTAVALFDSARVLSADSSRFEQLARVGAARAYLALGEYTEAGAAVTTVSDGFTYEIPSDTVLHPRDRYSLSVGSAVVSDSEGRTGIPYATSRDPRSAVDTPSFSDPDRAELLFPRYLARKYSADALSTIVLASGIEARLIQAEVSLRENSGGNEWLTILNTLRTTGTYTGVDTVVSGTTTHYDTAWVAGTGGVGGLGPLGDPGVGTLPAGTTPLRARLDLIFRERALWLFFTGHRQGDLRRRVRNDHVSHQQVYPTGAYPGGGTYGSDVTFPVPYTERSGNKKYMGCINREA